MSRVWVFRILTVLYLIAVAVLCFSNFSHMSEMPRTVFGLPADKVVHFVMFLPFPVLSYFSFDVRKAGPVPAMLLLVCMFALGCLLAWGTELIQSRIPYRSMDPADFKADRIGLICGSLVSFFILLLKHKKNNA
ncbi:MAG: VanZ family protein [Bacteroidales bacterium]|nr:VanZ family protein [Bacteroidales bacterium]